MNDVLGKTGTDKITGFTGVIIGRCEYFTGCNQLLLTPKVGKDGAGKESHWYDEQRVVIDLKAKKVVLDNGKTPGFDKAAPAKR